MRSLIRLLGGLGLLMIMIGIMVGVAGAQSNDQCLRYDTRDEQGNGSVATIDPVSGKQLLMRKPPPFTDSSNGDLSPDNKHIAYLVGPKDGPYSLYVDAQPYKKSSDGYIHCSID